jgi:xylan 1,4-beta-xylosidase
VRLADGSLTLAAHGDSIQTTSPLTRAATHPSYTVEVDIEITQGCEAGLILFYDSTHLCGLRLTSDPNTRSPDKTFLVHGGRATLRIVNTDQVAAFYYHLQDGPTAGKWTHIRDSLDITTYQQNAIGGFLDLRPALYACGTGSATFRNWKYEPK